MHGRRCTSHQLGVIDSPFLLSWFSFSFFVFFLLVLPFFFLSTEERFHELDDLSFILRYEKRWCLVRDSRFIYP